MTGKHGFLDVLKEVAFEDEPAPPEKHTPAPAAPAFSSPPFSAPAFSAPLAAPAAGGDSPVSYALPIDAGVVPDNDAVYQTLLTKTDFESTPTAATIHKFLDPLKAIPDTVMPSNVKFKTAVIQATAQAGLTEDGILGTFDTLKAKLQQEKDAFGGKSQQFAAREVAGRQDQIQKISAQITELQQELARLSNELVDAQGKATHAQSQFEAAVQRRGSELEQQRALYASLLKG
ncbi:MAG: hypothetical protein ABR912_03730 [Terracidiphilus sp.]|jgi:hypothetical protein